MTLRDRSWRGWRFYRTPGGVRNKGLITQKTEIWRAFAQFSRYRVETSQVRQATPRDRSWRGWRFYRTPGGVRNKGLITQKTVISSVHSHSFQDTELKLHMVQRQRLPWRQVVERLTIYYCTPEGSGIRVNHSKNVNWHAFAQFWRYRVETSQVRQWLLPGQVVEGLTILPYPRYPRGSEIKG